MKYAVAAVADQTLVYVTPNGSETLICAEAQLWDSRDEAEAVAIKMGRGFSETEEIGDETTFRLQYDMWDLGEDPVKTPTGHVLRPSKRPEPVPDSLLIDLREPLERVVRDPETDPEEREFFQLVGVHISERDSPVHAWSNLNEVPERDRPTRPVFEAVYLPHAGPITMVEFSGSRHVYSVYFLGEPEDLLARVEILKIMSS